MIDIVLKEKLLDGLQDAVSNYNAGMDEETAVAKSASDHGFNKAQTERLCELYNTSRTLNHFENNLGKKAEAFHLVDKNEVLNLLFDTTNEKMASEFAVHVDAAPDYEVPETDFYFCKSAREFPFDPVFSETELDVPDLNANSVRMGKQISRLQKEAEYLNDEAGIEMERAHGALSKLASSIISDYSGGNLAKVAAVIGVLATPENAGVFETLAGYLPQQVMKCNVKIARVVDDLSIPSEVKLIRQVSELTKHAEELLEQARKKLEICKQASSDFNSIVDGHLKKGRTTNGMDRFVCDGFRPLTAEKTAGALNAGLMALTLARTPKYVSEIRESPREIDDEISDANKRFVNMHRELLLTDLLNNDAYLSEEDPKVVAGYYSHFAQMAPELANNKEVVRSVLRQAVHNGGGGYSPFDAGSFLDAEKTLREIRGTLPKKEKTIVMPDSKDK